MRDNQITALIAAVLISSGNAENEADAIATAESLQYRAQIRHDHATANRVNAAAAKTREEDAE
jgi:hypothetical protein